MPVTDAKPPAAEASSVAEREGASDGAAQAPAAPASEAVTETFVASHHALFAEESSSLCDACGGPLGDAESTAGYGLQGRGVYLWARGDETRLESVPLCPACASAIGVTALARWEIEEEEG